MNAAEGPSDRQTSFSGRGYRSDPRGDAEELPTRSYNDLRVRVGYGRNLTENEQRYHTSFIKDLAPQRGRTIEAGVILRL